MTWWSAERFLFSLLVGVVLALLKHTAYIIWLGMLIGLQITRGVPPWAWGTLVGSFFVDALRERRILLQDDKKLDSGAIALTQGTERLSTGVSNIKE